MDSDEELEMLEKSLGLFDDEGPSNNAESAKSEPTESKTLKPFDFLSVESEAEGVNKAENGNKNLSLAKSLGLEDSSDDDEAVDNYLNRKFHEYGQGVHVNLRKAEKEETNRRIEAEVNKSIKRQASTPVIQPKPPTNVAPSNPNPLLSAQQAVSVFTDPVFGIKLIRPLISSSILKEKMTDKRAVSTCQIRNYVENLNKEVDWVIAGAIISKSPVKTSQNGNQYSIWQISDLRGADIKTVSVFLFKKAHSDLWKTAQGMVVAILNPNVLEMRSNSKDEATLSVINSQMVMILGQSKDLGTCKSKKKNGDPCSSIVNLSSCEFCIYHIKQEFRNVSQRAELQSSTAGRGLNDLRNKVLGKNEVFYGGQSFTAVPAIKSAKQVKRDKDRLFMLSEYNGTTTSPSLTRAPPKKKPAESVQASRSDRAKDLERLELLKSYNKTASSNENQRNLINSSLLNTTPKLSTGDFTIDLGSTFNPFKSIKPDVNKLKALEAIKKKPIVKSNPNFIKYRGTENGKRRLIDDIASSQTVVPEAKKLKTEQDEAKRKEEMRKTRIQKIMEATSSHSNLIELKENEAQQKYFNNLEKKEALEEKMVSTYKMPCKAVACKQCKYLAFKAADLCKQEKHPLKLMDAEKRFFKCRDCGNRTVTLQRLPKFSCKNCSSSKWEKTGMMKEKTVSLDTEKLSIRGDEETFIGSFNTSNLNLNLNVAEE